MEIIRWKSYDGLRLVVLFELPVVRGRMKSRGNVGGQKRAAYRDDACQTQEDGTFWLVGV